MKRQIIIEGDIARVPLTQGMEAIIDAADAHLVAGYDWSVMHSARTSYARRNQWTPEKQHTILLHRVILGVPAGVRVDHRDGDGLNCRRTNLRPATCAQNNVNTRPHCDNRCGLKGVSRADTKSLKFKASIQAGGIRRHLGLFDTPEAAHAAYCAASAIHKPELGRTA